MVPEVHLSVGRARRRLVSGTYHLKDGEEFELEIFNPLTEKIGCEISLNGKPISSSKLVLNPGQRVYLERGLDDNLKFKFSTYEVEDSPEAKAAISNNGLVSVRFFKEQSYFRWSTITWAQAPISPTAQPYTFSNTCDFNMNANIGMRSDPVDPPISSMFCCSSQIDSLDLTLDRSDATIETGRVEKGSVSSQHIGSTIAEFCPFSFHMASFKILPLSQVEASQIRQYCPECRCRIRKSSWKWCPQCGEEL
jgi:hypothetical protein